MKNLFLTIALVALTFNAMAQGGKAIYNKYSDLDGVEAIYISPAMFRLAGKIPDNVFSDNEAEINFAPLIKSCTGIYIISIPGGSKGNALYDDASKLLKLGPYELLMEAKDSGEVMRMYTIGDAETVNSFVFLAEDDDETSFICIDGKINRADLEEAIARSLADY